MQLTRNGNRNESGVTLVELLIYLVFASVVIGLSLEVTTASARSYVRGREVSKVQSNGRYAMAIMARDIMNTGFKMLIDTAGGSNSFRQLQGTWTGSRVQVSPPSDSAASFYYAAGDPGDTLEIFKAEMKSSIELDKVIRARYYIDTDHVLWRVTQEFDSTVLVGNSWINPDSIAISKNIEALQFRFSYDGVNWYDDPSGERHNVVAIEVSLLMRTEREVGGTVPSSYEVGDITFTPPSEDSNYLRRRYVETVEVANNGKIY